MMETSDFDENAVKVAIEGLVPKGACVVVFVLVDKNDDDMTSTILTLNTCPHVLAMAAGELARVIADQACKDSNTKVH